MERNEKTHLPVAALTHPGMKGKNNEDRFGVSAFRMRTQPPVPVLLAVLSDGIGGHRAGEVASELAVNTIIYHAAASDGKNPRDILEESIIAASQAIQRQAQQNPEQAGMGATCACAWIAGDRLFTATVGDSRIYLMRGGIIRQISTDHTWIQEALDRGIIEPDQANGHPNAHVIRRYLGSLNPPEVDFRIRAVEDEVENGLRLVSNDVLLLCSDGLTDLVSDQEILEAFRLSAIDEAGQQLIDLANQRGGNDNITLVAIQVPGENSVEKTREIHRRKPWSVRSLALGCFTIITAAVVIGAMAGGWLLFSSNSRTTPTPTATLNATRSLPLVNTSVPVRTHRPRWTSTFSTPTWTTTPAPMQKETLPSVTPIWANTPTRGLPVITIAP
jgi:protein phosphatase